MNETARTHPETVETGDAEMNQIQRRQPAKTELILPPPRNDAAALVHRHHQLICVQTPSGFDHQAFIAASIVEINRLPEDVTPNSVAVSVTNAAVLGLIPGDALGHAYFVPFNVTVDKRENRKERQAQLIVGYKGYIELALRNQFLRNVHANVVCEGEEFEYWTDSDGPQIYHEPDLDRDPTEKSIVASYCGYQTSNGGRGVVVVPRKAIQKAKAKNPNSDPWKYSYSAMAQKTAFIRASNEWRLTNMMAQAVMLDQQADRGVMQSALAPVDLPPMAPDQAPDAPKVGTRGERAKAVIGEDLDLLGARWEAAASNTGQPVDMQAWKQFVRSCTDLPGDRITQADCWTQDDLKAVRAGIERLEQEAAV